MTDAFVVWLDDSPDAFSRVAGVFRRWRLSVHAMTLVRSRQPGAHQLYVVFEGDPVAVRRQLGALHDVIEVREASPSEQAQVLLGARALSQADGAA